MTHSVYHVGLGIALNLTLPDLGHPTVPELWERLRSRPISVGVLQCMACMERDPDCPEWMYLREQNGRRQAVHHNTSIRDHPAAPESDKHKALKERIARAAERAGLRASLEDRAQHGKRITDVLIDGADGLRLGCEVQLSNITAQTVVRRSDIARNDGLTPLWTTDNPDSKIVHQAPWTVIGKTTAQRVAAGTDLLVTGGVRTVEADRCGRRGERCPRGSRRPCGRLHTHLTPALGVHLDRMVVGAAGGLWRPLVIPKSRGGFNYFWVSPEDLARYREDHDEQVAGPRHTRQEVPDVGPKPLDSSCHYRGHNPAGDPGRTAPATVAAPKCRCDGGQIKARCKLCPQSPNYWRTQRVVDLFARGEELMRRTRHMLRAVTDPEEAS